MVRHYTVMMGETLAHSQMFTQGSVTKQRGFRAVWLRLG